MTGGRVPLIDLARRRASLEPELSQAVSRVLQSGRFLLGPETEAFENEFARACGRRHAVAVASGTEALRLTLVALDLEPADEVIVPALTAVPTVAAVCMAGAVPVFVDVDPVTATIDPDSAAAAATPRTRAVIPVHLYGRPSALPDLGVPIIEDAAHAHGAVDRAPRSLAQAYSFYPTKNLGGVGDGGAVVTDDDGLAQRLRLLRTHGMRPGSVDYEHMLVSGNSRISEIEAAVLRVGLRRLDAGNERRRQIAARYRAAAPALVWQQPDRNHAYHLCVARVPGRPTFRARMPFETGVHYARALTEQPAYQRYERAACPHAEAWAAECVTLPCFPELTDGEVDLVSGALASYGGRPERERGRN